MHAMCSLGRLIVVSEFDRQRTFLERYGKSISHKVSHVESSSRSNAKKRLKENHQLMEEVNVLRRQNHDLFVQLKQLQVYFDHLFPPSLLHSFIHSYQEYLFFAPLQYRFLSPFHPRFVCNDSLSRGWEFSLEVFRLEELVCQELECQQSKRRRESVSSDEGRQHQLVTGAKKELHHCLGRNQSFHRVVVDKSFCPTFSSNSSVSSF
jgi:hypothetical protein